MIYWKKIIHLEKKLLAELNICGILLVQVRTTDKMQICMINGVSKFSQFFGWIAR